MNHLSKKDKLLLVACKLYCRIKEFTIETLTVEAWQFDKPSYGLQSYTELHPDAHKIICHLAGKKGLVKRGLLRKIGTKKYTMTTLGINTAKEMAGIE